MTDETPALPDDQLQIVLAARPVGVPQASDFRAVRGPVPTPADGEVLVRSAYLSLDPAMRGWMTDRKSYLPPVPLDGVMRGLVLGEVVASRDDRFAVGDAVSGVVGWQEYGVLPGDQLDRVPGGVRPEEAMGPLGMTGLTAYFGLFDVGAPKAGETVLVSAAAGAVGSIVGQLAKIHGCRVVGTAGSDAKCAWLVDELGFDAAVNYRDADGTAKGVDGLQTELNAACPKGVDVYFDNVGGDLLDAALRLLRRRGRLGVVLRDRAAQHDAAATPQHAQRGVEQIAADVVEVDVDALRA
ncbi:MAG: NADP-dependent oxidoreductase, partial [Acidobacteriota bacterium]